MMKKPDGVARDRRLATGYSCCWWDASRCRLCDAAARPIYSVPQHLRSHAQPPRVFITFAFSWPSWLIFLVVFTRLTYAVIKFREEPAMISASPPQYIAALRLRWPAHHSDF